jgi:hypothetical protein
MVERRDCVGCTWRVDEEADANRSYIAANAPAEEGPPGIILSRVTWQQTTKRISTTLSRYLTRQIGTNSLLELGMTYYDKDTIIVKE